jgi:hypothetical protein
MWFGNHFLSNFKQNLRFILQQSQYVFTVILVLLAGPQYDNLSTYSPVVGGPVFAEEVSKNRISSAIDLEEIINNIKPKINSIDKELNSIKQDISTLKLDIHAAKKLEEISSKNLSAPMYIFTIIIALIAGAAAVLGGALYIVTKNIYTRIDDEVRKINEEADKQKKEFEILKNDHMERKKDIHELLAHAYNAGLVADWGKGRFDSAIKWGERAIENAEEGFGKTPEDPQQREILNRYRSNLAYLIAEKRMFEKAGLAIEFAKMGLESGISVSDIQLIDNFLFITMIFGKKPEDKELWLEIYERYKGDIESISSKEELKIFDSYSNELKK